jgi:hypothetical protein
MQFFFTARATCPAAHILLDIMTLNVHDSNKKSLTPLYGAFLSFWLFTATYLAKYLHQERIHQHSQTMFFRKCDRVSEPKRVE